MNASDVNPENLKMKKGMRIIEGKQPEFPVRRLREVPHKDGNLIVSHFAFGYNPYLNNLAEMNKSYSNPDTGKRILFREPTTAESISIAHYGFGSEGEVDVKRDIFYHNLLQIGRMVKTSEGVYANPPKDEKGNPTIDEKILKSFLDKSKKVNGIWLYLGDDPNARDFGFAPQESFEFVRGNLCYPTFAKGGLARVLEHTKETTAENLSEIASYKNYSGGVNVYGFYCVKDPILMVAVLSTSRGVDDAEYLTVTECFVDGDRGGIGYTFGVLK